MRYTYLVKYDFETEYSAGTNCRQFVTVDEPIDTQEKLNELRIPVSTDGVPVNVWVTDIALMNVEQEAPPKHAPGVFEWHTIEGQVNVSKFGPIGPPPLKREFELKPVEFELKPVDFGSPPLKREFELKREFKYAQAVWPCPSKHVTEHKVHIGSEIFYFETAQDAGLVLGRLSHQFRWARDFR